MALAASSLALLTSTPAQAADPVDIQILATNDFHGRLLNNTNNEAGAAVLSGAVKELRTENPNTAFVAAGDLIGASTFESFIQQDVPTIDALNEAGLDVSAVGNHELDQGFDDLSGRVQELADWEYIVANLRLKTSGDHALAPTWTQELGGVTVGYVGAVTEELPALVSPDGIASLDVTDIVDEVNAAAADLTADGADVVVMLVHEGAPAGTTCDAMDDDPTSAFGSIVTGVSADVDAIVSGHTHQAYDCTVGGRPVVSAGQYGSNLNQIVFTVDPDDGAISSVTHEILALESCGDTCDADEVVWTPNYPADPAVETIVDDAVAVAEVEGSKPVGRIDGAFDRARFAGGESENRGGESTLGNLVAEIQRWATRSEALGAAQIAFMNPGGLRADLRGVNGQGEDAGPYPRLVNLRGAANVQPFANSLVNMDLTGEQIEAVLEEQWQPAGVSRPFLRLGASKGFTYTYEPPAAGSPAGTKGEVLGMWLNGEPIDPAATYSVTVNSFLSAGGDNFTTFRDGSGKAEAGLTDLEAQVAYFKANVSAQNPLKVDYSQRAVGVVGLPDVFEPGEEVTLELSSLSMTGPTDITDDEVSVLLGDQALGQFPVTTEPPPPGNGNSSDEIGKATVTFTVPVGNTAGPEDLIILGPETFTCVGPKTDCPRPREPATANLQVKTKPKKVVEDRTRAKVIAIVRAAGEAAKGRIEVKVSGKTYKAKLKENGRAMVTLKKFAKPGKKIVKVIYLGNANTLRAVERVTIKVRKRR